MGDLMDNLRREQGRILLRENFKRSLKLFVAGFLLAVILGVPGAIWFLNVEISLLKEQAFTADERRQKWEEEAKRQTQVAEQYRDRFFAITKTNGSFANFSDSELQDYAFRMVRALRTPIREHETNINKLEAVVYSAALSKRNVPDLQKMLEERSTAEWEAGQRCMAVYNIAFKPDVLALRREILSRIAAGNDIDQNGLSTDYWYDSPWNFYGFKKMVTDLDRIARQLPASKGQAGK